MLFICNGSWKSGTTWLTTFFNVQKKDFDPLPAEYNLRGTHIPMVEEELLARIGDYDFYKGRHVFAKVHLFDRDWALGLLDMPEVRVLSIVRDVRDQFVSRFYFDKLQQIIHPDLSFDRYFDNFVKWHTMEILQYASFWYVEPGRGPITTAYEYLKADPTAALLDFRAALRLPDPEVFDVDLVRKKTDFSTYKDSGPGQFRRKGIVGDYRNHMSKDQESHLKRLLREGDYGATKRRIARLHPCLEPYLAETDVGFD